MTERQPLFVWWDGFKLWDRKRDLPVVVLVPLSMVVLGGWSYWSGRALRRELAKLDQVVGPLAIRDEELSVVAARLAGSAKDPLPYAVCEEKARARVTVISTTPMSVRQAFESLALQTGTVFRPVSVHRPVSGADRVVLRLNCASGVGSRREGS